jgi:hypothetical protein
VFEAEPEGKMVIKGREHERTKAWLMAKNIILVCALTEA